MSEFVDLNLSIDFDETRKNMNKELNWIIQGKILNESFLLSFEKIVGIEDLHFDKEYYSNKIYGYVNLIPYEAIIMLAKENNGKVMEDKNILIIQ